MQLSVNYSHHFFFIPVSNISRVLDQSGVSQGCYIVERYRSGRKPLIWICVFFPSSVFPARSWDWPFLVRFLGM